MHDFGGIFPFPLIVCHTLSAKQVVYSTEALLDKNKDFAIVEHASLIANSASPFVRCVRPLKVEGLAWQRALVLGAVLKPLNEVTHEVLNVKPFDVIA